MNLFKLLPIWFLPMLFAMKSSAQLTGRIDVIQDVKPYVRLDTNLATNINNYQVWDYFDQFVVPLGFNFVFGEDTFNTFQDFNLVSGGLVSANNNSNFIGYFIGWELADGSAQTNRPDSAIGQLWRYTSGNAGQRICTIECRDAIRDRDANTQFNFQFKLYEATSIFEIHFGKIEIDNDDWKELSVVGNAPNFLFLYTRANEGLNFSTYVAGTPSNTVIIQKSYVPTEQVDVESYTFLEVPDSGTVWQFKFTNTTSVQYLNENLNTLIFPNPLHGDFLSIKANTTAHDYIEIFDVAGKFIVKISIQNNQVQLPMELKNGVYFMKIHIGENTTTDKLMLCR